MLPTSVELTEQSLLPRLRSSSSSAGAAGASAEAQPRVAADQGGEHRMAGDEGLRSVVGPQTESRGLERRLGRWPEAADLDLVGGARFE